MTTRRVSLFDRLPEIYRVRDAESTPNDQLKSYLAAVEEVFGEIHKNIEELYSDLFIETCQDWVIPYIGDLLGTSPLKGEPWSLRADVADTIALRRRKGTLGAIALLTYDLTRWATHCVELRQNLVWNQHLNHQRPDAGGKPPYASMPYGIYSPVRGGTVTLRDPAMLSLVNTPFDPFGHFADLRPRGFGQIRYNLPNLAIFLWRLAAYRVSLCRPYSDGVHERWPRIDLSVYPDAANTIVRFYAHPLGRPVQLFNTYDFNPDRYPPVLAQLDGTPGPIPAARLNSNTPAGNPDAYVECEPYDHTDASLESITIWDVGFQIHLPDSITAPEDWLYRGTDLLSWEHGLNPPLRDREIAIDPKNGRFVIGVTTQAQGEQILKRTLITYTYGSVGPVGAHPVTRFDDAAGSQDDYDRIDVYPGGDYTLAEAVDAVAEIDSPVIIEIHDSMVHNLTLANIPSLISEEGHKRFDLNHSLTIKAADGHRPIIKLDQPFRFNAVDPVNTEITVQLDGLYLTRRASYGDKEPLIAQADIVKLEITACTLDPEGYVKFNGSRAPIQPGIRLSEISQQEPPQITLYRTITGPLFISNSCPLHLHQTIVDAGQDPAALAISGADDPEKTWGPPTLIDAVTVLGRVRVEELSGLGGIFASQVNVKFHQSGCVKYSSFTEMDNTLPQHHGCVFGAELHFVSQNFGDPAYCQLARITDYRIREKGPNDDAMGAFGFLMEAHKWRNIQIRYREFMPVDIRPLLIPVT